jgi:hypothetical protein
MLACPASFFTIPNKSEGFQTSWNDRQCGLTYELLSNSENPLSFAQKILVSAQQFSVKNIGDCFVALLLAMTACEK